MAEADQRIAALACACTHLDTKWIFLPISPLQLNKRVVESACVGKLTYYHKLFEIGFSVRVGQYVFCLERLSAHGLTRLPLGTLWYDGWNIAAFHKDLHYTFFMVPNDSNARNTLLTWVAAKILPILARGQYPCTPPIDGAPIKISW